MQIKTLQAQVMAILHLLDNNLEEASKEYKDGSISNGAFSYVLGRHAMAYDILHNPAILDMDAEELYKKLAILTIDLRSAVNDDKTKQEFLDNWLAFYVNAGFTGVHGFLNIPVFIEPQLELNI